MLSSCADVAAVCFLAAKGILMSAISPVLIAGLLIVVVLYLVFVDFAKIRIFSRLRFG